MVIAERISTEEVNPIEYKNFTASPSQLGLVEYKNGRFESTILHSTRSASEVANYSTEQLLNLAKEDKINHFVIEDRYFFPEDTLRNLLIPEGYVDVEKAEEISGLKQSYLKQLATKGIVDTVIRKHKVYFDKDSLHNYTSGPQGFVDVKTALNWYPKTSKRVIFRLIKSGELPFEIKKGKRYVHLTTLGNLVELPYEYVNMDKASELLDDMSPEQIRRLKNNGTLKGKIIKGSLFIDPSSIQKYNNPHPGYVSPSEAKQRFNTTDRVLGRLKKIGSVRTKAGKRVERVFYNIEDLERELVVPEGFIDINEMADQYGYVKRHIFEIAKNHQFRRKRIGRVTYISTEDMGNYVAWLENPETQQEVKTIDLAAD